MKIFGHVWKQVYEIIVIMWLLATLLKYNLKLSLCRQILVDTVHWCIVEIYIPPFPFILYSLAEKKKKKKKKQGKAKGVNIFQLRWKSLDRNIFLFRDRNLGHVATVLIRISSKTHWIHLRIYSTILNKITYKYDSCGENLWYP